MQYTDVRNNELPTTLKQASDLDSIFQAKDRIVVLDVLTGKEIPIKEPKSTCAMLAGNEVSGSNLFSCELLKNIIWSYGSRVQKTNAS